MLYKQSRKNLWSYYLFVFLLLSLMIACLSMQYTDNQVLKTISQCMLSLMIALAMYNLGENILDTLRELTYKVHIHKLYDKIIPEKILDRLIEIRLEFKASKKNEKMLVYDTYSKLILPFITHVDVEMDRLNRINGYGLSYMCTHTSEYNKGLTPNTILGYLVFKLNDAVNDLPEKLEGFFKSFGVVKGARYYYLHKYEFDPNIINDVILIIDEKSHIAFNPCSEEKIESDEYDDIIYFLKNI